ncbi:MAG: tetratricopeptide repeat protein [candidate division WOR-3 bacterium]
MNSYSMYEKEIKELLEDISRNPKSKSFIKLANIYLKVNMVDESLAVLKEGLRYNVDNVSALILYGKALKEKKDFVNASKNFEKVIKLDPQNIVAFSELAEIKKREGNLQEALKLYDTILFLDPLNEDAKRELKIIRGKIEEENRIKEEKEKLLKKKEEEKKEVVQKDAFEEKKIVDDFIIQHSSNVISFDEEEKKEEKKEQTKNEKQVEKEKKVETKEDKEMVLEHSKTSFTFTKEEKINTDNTEKDETTEKKGVGIIDEEKFIKKDVDPFIKKEDKKEEKIIPYELSGTKRFLYFSEEMANIYVEQKKYEKAIDIYQTLLRQNPDEERYAEKIRTLRELMIKEEVDEEMFKSDEGEKKENRAEFIEKLNRSLSFENVSEEEKVDFEKKFGNLEENVAFETKNVEQMGNKTVVEETEKKESEEKIEEKKEVDYEIKKQDDENKTEEKKQEKSSFDGNFQEWIKFINQKKK